MFFYLEVFAAMILFSTIYGLVISPENRNELRGVLGGGLLNLITGIATAPSTTLTALTMATGDSLTIKNSPKPAYLLAAWGDWQTAGNLQIMGPSFHDQARGLYLYGVSSIVQPLLYPPEIQYSMPQDTLTAKISGSGTAGDIETACMLWYYPEYPTNPGSFITYEEYMARRVRITTIENTLALGTAGGYSGSEGITSEQDNLKGNTDYAILGANVSVECACIGWSGPESGGVRIGMPGCEDNKAITSNWFLWLAYYTGWPLIPVFNSANKAGWNIDGAQDENGADPLVTTILAQLR